MKLIPRTGAFPVSFLGKLQGQTGLGAEVRQEWAAKCAEVSVFTWWQMGRLTKGRTCVFPKAVMMEARRMACKGASRDQKSQQGIKISLRNTWKVIPPREPSLFKAATQFG